MFGTKQSVNCLLPKEITFKHIFTSDDGTGNKMAQLMSPSGIDKLGGDALKENSHEPIKYMWTKMFSDGNTLWRSPAKQEESLNITWNSLSSADVPVSKEDANAKRQLHELKAGITLSQDAAVVPGVLEKKHTKTTGHVASCDERDRLRAFEADNQVAAAKVSEVETKLKEAQDANINLATDGVQSSWNMFTSSKPRIRRKISKSAALRETCSSCWPTLTLPGARSCKARQRLPTLKIT